VFDDLDALGGTLARWFAGRHPDARDVAVAGLEKSSGGFSNITLLAELTWTRGRASRELGIAVRVQPLASAVYPDCDVRRQYRTMELLAGSEVPVPRLLGLEQDAAAIGAPFFVMERIDGQVPNENPLYHLEGWFHDLGDEAKRRHWFSAIDTLAALGRVDWRALGFDFLLPPAGRTALSHQLEYYRRHMEWAESLGRPYPFLHQAYRWLLAHQPKDEPMSLLWGDAKLGNCVYRDGKLVGALDWEMAALGNPVDDLAWWLTLDESMCTGYGLPRLAGLPSRDETVACWERVTGRSARDLPYYDVYAAWRFAIVMARIGTIFMERGYVPRESGMDVKNGGATLLAALARRHGF
jgi:aminoglycoside phosphotransferase (APT) family kinase protein